MAYQDPDTQRTYKREWARMRRAGECGTPSGTLIPLPFRLKTVADVMTLLEEQVAAVRGEPDAGALEKARTVGFLAGIVLRAIESGAMEARIEALEQKLEEARHEGPGKAD